MQARLMTENDDAEAVLEPRPTVTPLTGNESAPDTTMLATVCWLLQRYSSASWNGSAEGHTV
jgi:hypothetical protein